MFFIVRNQHTRKKMKNNILYKALWVTTENFRIYTSTNACKAVKGQQKRTTQKNDARNKTERKRLGIYKRNKTQNMPTSEELWGDLPSGLAAASLSVRAFIYLYGRMRLIWRQFLRRSISKPNLIKFGF